MLICMCPANALPPTESFTLRITLPFKSTLLMLIPKLAV
ncbi:hypothetical protein FF38_12630 [Lucilia cuprina]|uniref:Uncharacterized protein n=1 Tax=Lucilia cuprina TaxID=7375 RepID=A0A0L0C4B7_LUCCU|nr:hypothetical protein FF38_12630 [Lucilia cuprina]